MNLAQIILVDDNLPLLDLMAQLFRLDGYTVEVLDSLEKTGEYFNKTAGLSPALIILDFMLGNAKTSRLARRIKEVCPNVQIIMVSGCPPSEMPPINQLKDDGIIELFMEKPYRYSDVKAFISERELFATQ